MSAVIEKEDLISDAATAAPLILTENFKKLDAELDIILSKTVTYKQLISGDVGTKKLATETQALTESNKQLAAIQKQVLTAAAKSNDEYIEYAKTLKLVKDTTKQKTELGDRDAKTITRQNASIKQLGAALAINRAEYSKLTTQQERNSKAGKELLAVITAQDEGFKAERKSMGQAQDEVGNYEGALKKLKAELLASKDELVGIATTLGTDSEEFSKAAEKTGLLKDQINDINDAIKNTEASPFENLSKSLGSVVDKLKAGDFSGAAAGAKQFAQASKAITLKEAIKGFKDLGSTVVSVGRAILTNPLFLLAAVLIGLTILVVKFYDKIKPLKLIFDLVGAGIQYVIQALKDLSDFMGLSSFAAEESAARIVDAYGKARESLTEYYDTEITLANAAGANTLFLELQKQQAISQTADVQIKALEGLKKKTLTTFDAMAIGIKTFFGVSTEDDWVNKLTDEQEAQLKELTKLRKDALTQTAALELSNYAKQVKADNDNIRIRKNNQYELNAYVLNESIKLQQAIADNNATYENLRNNAAKRANDYRIALANLESKQQKSLLQDQFTELKQAKQRELDLAGDDGVRIMEITKRFIKEEKDLRANVATQLVLINKQKNDKIKASELQLANDLSKISIFNLEEQRNTQDQITSNEAISYDKRLKALSNATQLEYQILQEQFTKRKELGLATIISEEEYNNRLLANEQRYTEQYIKLLTDRINRAANLDKAQDSGDTSNDLDALNKQYARREISTKAYLKRRKDLLSNAQDEELFDEIDRLEQLIEAEEIFGAKAIELRAQLAAAREAISQKEAEEELRYRTELNEKLNELGQAAFDSAVTIGQNLFDAGDQQRQAELEAIQTKQEQELQLAGDNEAAKNEINNRAAAATEKNRQQQIAADRKRANFEKVSAAVSIAINTAKGIGQALGNFPPPASFVLAAVIGAIGAVQLAAVLSKPIPQYAVGTDNHQGGPAIIGEKGSERVTLPSGQTFLSPNKATLLDLPKGTKVETHEETMQRLAFEGLRPQDSTRTYDNREAILGQKIDALHNTMRNKSELHLNFSKNGAEAVFANAESRTKVLNSLYR